MYKFMTYVGCVTVSMKTNEEMGASQGRYRHPGIELPASWQTRDGEKPASRRDLLPSLLQRMLYFCQIRLSQSIPTHMQVMYARSPNMANFCGQWMEKFVLEFAYRETRPPFWDALISRYRHPMTNGVITPPGVSSCLKLISPWAKWPSFRRRDRSYIRVQLTKFRWLGAYQAARWETVSPEGTFCDTVQVPSRGGDMELI